MIGIFLGSALDVSVALCRCNKYTLWSKKTT